MRIGVVGCGYWGSKHVRVLEGIDEVTSVVAIDAREERTTALRRSFPRLSCYPSLAHALDRDAVDAVVVATPPHTHTAIAIEALRAGKHVLVEKPFATSVADADTMIAEATRAGGVLMAGHTFEFNPAVHRLRELMSNAELGQTCYIDTARLNLGLYQSDVNVFWDLAPHDVSIVNYLLGSPPTRVHAWGLKNAHADHEDVGYLRLEYGHVGVTANVHVSWLDPCKVRRVTVVGSDKMAVYNDLHDQERLRVYDKGVVTAAVDPSLHGMPASYRYGDITSPYIDFREPLALQDEHFVACIRGGLHPLVDGESGRAVVSVLEAAARSLAEDRAVPIEETAASRREELAGAASNGALR